jgi:threonine dehydratase
MSVGIDDARAARARIAALVRPTPVLAAQPAGCDAAPGARLWLKLENLQITGSFKARGATAKLTALTPDAVRRGIVTASGGNHGLAVAYAGWIARAPTVIYLPETTPKAKVAQFERWGAEVVIAGGVWDEANAAAQARAEADGLTYFHPFADPAVIAGQGTVALELFEQVPALDLLVVAIGGGGLISGIATVAKALRPAVRIVGVEPTGAPTHYESRHRGELVTLPAVPTAAVTLAPRRSEPINFEIVGRLVDDIVLVSDDEMREAARWLWLEFGIAAELAGAAAVAALLTGRIPVPEGANVTALVCGAGVDGIA